MLYVHQVCQGCCTYIRCVGDVVCTSGVSGMLYICTSGVSGMLYVHQVCQGCCTYIRCVRGVVRTSGVSGMLYVHQVCQGCCSIHVHTRLHTPLRSALWIPLLAYLYVVCTSGGSGDMYTSCRHTYITVTS